MSYIYIYYIPKCGLRGGDSLIRVPRRNDLIVVVNKLSVGTLYY